MIDLKTFVDDNSCIGNIINHGNIELFWWTLLVPEWFLSTLERRECRHPGPPTYKIKLLSKKSVCCLRIELKTVRVEGVRASEYTDCRRLRESLWIAGNDGENQF